MQFLFHTIIKFDNGMVYYNVFKNDRHYFIQVLHNPNSIDSPVAFNLKKVSDEWKCSVTMTERQIQVLGEEIEQNERQ